MIKPTEHQKLCNCADCMPESIEKQFKQPNPNLKIVKTIQERMHVITNELEKLKIVGNGGSDNEGKLLQYNIKNQALEDVDLFERTTLFELQKAFE